MNDNTKWFSDCGWGIINHYLSDPPGKGNCGLSVDKWNDKVNSFDVELLAEQLNKAKVGYYMITIGQGSGYYCAPNKIYDSIVGINPSKCSRRDLILDISEALEAYEIPLLVYIPADGSWGDFEAREKLGMIHHWNDYPNGDYDWSQSRQPELMLKWERVVKEWSHMWGEKVKGWWVDGCFKPEIRYPENEEPNFASLSKALKSGNPKSIVAFNPAVHIPVISCTKHEDYTAGEIALSLPECHGGFVDFEGHKSRFHIMSYLGSDWGVGKPRYSNDLVASYTHYINAKGGIVTWDVPINSNGTIPEEFLLQLSNIKL